MRTNQLVEARYGCMLVNSVDTYVGGAFVHAGEFSEHEVDAFRALVKTGDVVLDIGANIGAHTVPLAQLVGDSGRVIAFEPQYHAFQLLAANVALNDLWHVETIRAAIGSVPGRVTIPRLDPRVPNNFGGLAVGGPGETVMCITIDSLSLGRLDFAKIDVEGHELAVLDGMRETIARHRPVLYVEADREQQRAPLLAWLRARGYTVLEHTPPLWNENNHAGATSNPWPGVVSINWLCLPDDRAAPELRFLVPVEG